MIENDFAGTWALNARCRQRKSPNDITLVFIPRQNIVVELNAEAGCMLELFRSPASLDQVCDQLHARYSIGDQVAFREEVNQIFQRFVRHEIVVRIDGKP